jgi:hypothetical protein
MAVTEAVVADGVPRTRNATQQRAVLARPPPHDEERRMDTGVRQQVEDARRPFGVGTVVEREVHAVTGSGTLLEEGPCVRTGHRLARKRSCAADPSA